MKNPKTTITLQTIMIIQNQKIIMMMIITILIILQIMKNQRQKLRQRKF